MLLYCTYSTGYCCTLCNLLYGILHCTLRTLQNILLYSMYSPEYIVHYSTYSTGYCCTLCNLLYGILHCTLRTLQNIVLSLYVLYVLYRILYSTLRTLQDIGLYLTYSTGCYTLQDIVVLYVTYSTGNCTLQYFVLYDSTEYCTLLHALYRILHSTYSTEY